ncbi:hypothetical protein FBEOM_12971 [Fusarium beomiforme]|uniref:Uncharacterized protein n=1 Tax=Fusarium beomiforme TaxID=44412 RepID=A0A9P5DPL0_9HYPO|nr:hypothetical protein FBEOM_12971 [Fusarium beomiforme]
MIRINHIHGGSLHPNPSWLVRTTQIYIESGWFALSYRLAMAFFAESQSFTNITCALFMEGLETITQITSTSSPIPIVMPNPHYITVPRGEDISPDTKQQSHTSSSEQMKNWLREGHKDMPWHNLDSVVSRTQDRTNSNSDSNAAPSDTAATQGSDK